MAVHIIPDDASVLCLEQWRGNLKARYFAVVCTLYGILLFVFLLKVLELALRICLHVKGKEKLWVFRLVQRPSGLMIISNYPVAFVTTGPCIST